MNTLPPAGEEASFSLGDGLTVRHGSSLSLMVSVCEFLANPVQDDSFSYVDPTADHQKWGRKGLSLYYAGVTTEGGALVCALRAATQDAAPTGIFLIDYVYSAPGHRDRGIAGDLIRKVLDVASSQQNTAKFVLSIEESCVYWMEKHGFFLCTSAELNERLNVFPDTHLLVMHDSKAMVESLARQPRQQRNNNASSEETAMQSTTTTTTTTTIAVPPESFAAALGELQLLGTSQPDLPSCLTTLATLVQNARDDDSEDGRRRTIRMTNPNVHRRVFAVGGEPAMKLLQCCGFALQVNDQGDAVLRYAPDETNQDWLDAAVAQLQYEGGK